MHATLEGDNEATGTFGMLITTLFPGNRLIVSEITMTSQTCLANAHLDFRVASQDAFQIANLMKMRAAFAWDIPVGTDEHPLEHR